MLLKLSNLGACPKYSYDLSKLYHLKLKRKNSESLIKIGS